MANPSFFAISIYSRDDYSKAGVVVYPNSRSILYTVKLINFFYIGNCCLLFTATILGVSVIFMAFCCCIVSLCFQVICLRKGYRSIGKIDIENSWAKKVLLCVNYLSTIAANLDVYFVINLR